MEQHWNSHPNHILPYCYMPFEIPSACPAATENLYLSIVLRLLGKVSVAAAPESGLPAPHLELRAFATCPVSTTII